MTRRDASVVGVTAVATALAGLVLFWTGPVVATDGAKAEQPWPVLREGGVEITLRTDRTAYQPGETPTLELVAANPTQSPVTVEATLRMMVRREPSFISREMPIARPTWERKLPLTLAAGERKAISIPETAKVAAGTDVSFQLQIGKARVTTAPISVPGLALRNLAQPVAGQAPPRQASR